MTIHRFFVGTGVIDEDHATLRGDQAKQIASVLRLGPDDHVIFVRDGTDHEVRLDAVAPSEVRGTVVLRRPNRNEPRIHLTLALPLLRGDRSEEVLEAVTQLGVARVVPFVSERSVSRELSDVKRVRWERIARESAETARRGRIAQISSVVQWPRLFDVLAAPVLVPWEKERELLLLEALDQRSTALAIVIGPEGGLTSDEIEHARERGARTVSLGPRNLRSETAAVAAVAVTIARTGG